MARYLERAGYSTHVAADGPDALRIGGETRRDLVVLDLMLPGMDGLDVMRRLSARDAAPRGVLFNLIQNAIRHTPPDRSVTVFRGVEGRERGGGGGRHGPRRTAAIWIADSASGGRVRFSLQRAG